MMRFILTPYNFLLSYHFKTIKIVDNLMFNLWDYFFFFIIYGNKTYSFLLLLTKQTEVSVLG